MQHFVARQPYCVEDMPLLQVLIDVRLGKCGVGANVPSQSRFGPNSYPESHRFFDLEIVSNETDFATFVNTCNRCFVESIESYGRSINKSHYFWEEIKSTYPALSMALRRIKIYRHNRVHIKLVNGAPDELHLFLSRDLAGRSPGGVPELWFQLQQCVLDDLLVGAFVEADRLA